jgi:hypothetical protein
LEGRTLTARDLQRWFEHNRAALGQLRISAHFGSGPTLGRADSSTWISLQSRWATGRLVRASSGSSQYDAHRFADGAIVLRENRADTSEDQLDDLVTALGRPDGPRRYPPVR